MLGDQSRFYVVVKTSSELFYNCRSDMTLKLRLRENSGVTNMVHSLK